MYMCSCGMCVCQRRETLSVYTCRRESACTQAYTAKCLYWVFGSVYLWAPPFPPASARVLRSTCIAWSLRVATSYSCPTSHRSLDYKCALMPSWHPAAERVIDVDYYTGTLCSLARPTADATTCSPFRGGRPSRSRLLPASGMLPVSVAKIWVQRLISFFPTPPLSPLSCLAPLLRLVSHTFTFRLRSSSGVRAAALLADCVLRPLSWKTEPPQS